MLLGETAASSVPVAQTCPGQQSHAFKTRTLCANTSTPAPPRGLGTTAPVRRRGVLTHGNMTGHSERERRHRGQGWGTRLHDDSSPPARATLTRPPTHSPEPSAHSRRFTIFVLFPYWSEILRCLSSSQLDFGAAAITSVSPCTIPQTRPTKRALVEKTSEISTLEAG